MVIEAKDTAQNIVLKVQDTGGQPIFLSILELLTTQEGTIYLVVFSLPKLQQAFEDTVETTVGQLKSIQLFATGAPVILVGTRKDDVTGGAKALKDLSTKLLAALQSQCGPAVKGLERDSEGDLCFFAIENSKGIKGDSTIRQLVKAIERAARKLPSMQMTLPPAWLRVHDELKQRQKRCLPLEEVRGVAQRFGVPSADVSVDEELTMMLTFFHSQNALLWYDTPTLRNLVILDPKWVIDAATCFIRQHNLPDHTKNYLRMADLDNRARREEPQAWDLLTTGAATLQRKVALTPPLSTHHLHHPPPPPPHCALFARTAAANPVVVPGLQGPSRCTPGPDDPLQPCHPAALRRLPHPGAAASARGGTACQRPGASLRTHAHLLLSRWPQPCRHLPGGTSLEMLRA